jgi:hypothetical protein
LLPIEKLIRSLNAAWNCSIPSYMMDPRHLGGPMRWSALQNHAQCIVSPTDPTKCWSGLSPSCRDKIAMATNGTVRFATLTCGASQYQPGHWCNAVRAFYRKGTSSVFALCRVANLLNATNTSQMPVLCRPAVCTLPWTLYCIPALKMYTDELPVNSYQQQEQTLHVNRNCSR